MSSRSAPRRRERVAELMVAPGAHVRKGQHLARIECAQIERELEARKSDLEAAEAAFIRTVHGPRPEEINVGIANVNHAEARLEEAEKVLQRTMLLREGFTVTRVQIDQAQRDARMARRAARRSPCQACLAPGPVRGQKTSRKRTRGAMPPRGAWKKRPRASATARSMPRSAASF